MLSLQGAVRSNDLGECANRCADDAHLYLDISEMEGLESGRN